MSHRISTRRSTVNERPRSAAQALSVGLVGNCADVHSGTGAARHRARHSDRPDQRARPALKGYVPNGMTLAEALALRCSNPDEYVRRSIDAMAQHVARHARVETHGRGDVRLRQQHPRPGQARRRRGRFRHPRLRARVHSPAVLRRPRAISLGRALGIARRHPHHRPASARTVPRQRQRCSAGCDSPGPHPVSRACPRASAGSATASAPSSAWR